ncbi:hypothetical protein AB0912_15780 [Streptomyces sp. NPDC007084]|uniref:hypothetical protein n=1 Tax=Streptomyces sp. NPDC007084 TaxID=3154313 RepID=UPI0034550205
MLCPLWARLGWRGTALLSSGLSWISYGASIAIQPRYGTVRGISVLLHLLPMTGWGVIWIVAGGIASGYALVRPGRDLIGVGAAMAPPLLWAVAYALGAITGTSATAWGAIAPWAGHALLIQIIAFLTSPRVTVLTVVARGAD